jgi:hypothetical protein
VDPPPWVDQWCRSFLAARPVEAIFSVSHLSDVVGVRLADGREVVLKRRADESGRARRCVTAQRLLAEQSFPCPRPLTEAIVSDGVAVHAEELVRGGEVEQDDSSRAAARSAAHLCDLIRRLAGLPVEPPLPNPEWVRWESLPDRKNTASVPQWIEETTRRVQTKLAGSDLPRLVGHADWEAQNMHWSHGELLAVHDWDSLALLPEAGLVGTASGVFATYGRPMLAPIGSSAAFLDAYEDARGRPFSAHEREVAWAASLWVALHNACDELTYDRPRLTYDSLRAQRLERLARAKA